MTLLDSHGRPLANLRISVTDRCNLRCGYCMPEEEYVWLPKTALLSFEEIDRLVGVFSGLGVSRVRLTGGEPLLRRDLDRLVTLLSARPALADIAMTTNGLLLAEQAKGLAAAGLKRVSVSLDTLQPDRFQRMTRRTGLEHSIAGIHAARVVGLPTKLNMVVMRGQNDDEIVDLLEFAKDHGAELRFIEYMDVGGATDWSADTVVSRAEILSRLGAHYGSVSTAPAPPSAPADRFQLPDGTIFGIVSSTTEPFCGSCDRSRLTADGKWYLCLYARVGLDLSALMRSGVSDEDLASRIEAAWTGRSDRGAEERLGLAIRTPLAGADELRANPHLEMHTRGG